MMMNGNRIVKMVRPGRLSNSIRPVVTADQVLRDREPESRAVRRRPVTSG